MTLARTDPAAFVRAHTHVAPVPFVPEIRLHQADDAFMLWETSERDLARQGVPLPYWAFPWAGGTALARHLVDRPELVEERRVLDLGTGSGLVAIAAALAGAAQVTAVDVDPIALAAVELNASLNDVEVVPSLEDLLDAPRHPLLGPVEVVLAGDVAYERPMAKRIFGLLFGLASRGREVYVGDPGRSYIPTEQLDPVGSYDVPVLRALENADVKRTTVWRVATPG